jgi:hypothetical protein
MHDLENSILQLLFCGNFNIYTFNIMRRDYMKKQYEEPTMETILFEVKRNVFTIQSAESGGGTDYEGGGEDQGWASS